MFLCNLAKIAVSTHILRGKVPYLQNADTNIYVWMTCDILMLVNVKCKEGDIDIFI